MGTAGLVHARCSPADGLWCSLVMCSALATASTYVRACQMYRYSGDGSEQDLLAFLSHEYREVHTEDVPPPPSMWSDISEKLLDFWDEWWTTVRSAP